MDQAVIETTDLRRSFGDVDAVAGVDLTVTTGEIYGFLGPNGAGKSTVVKMLTTLLKPTGGSAKVLGLDVATQADQIRLRIGAALQDASLDEKQSGREILTMQGELYGLKSAEIDRRIEELRSVIEYDAIDRWVGTYSGGMERRLDLAASLIHNPDLLFLDEPTTGLDPTSRAQVWEEVRRLNRDYGTTIFLTTQYLEEADELADRVGGVGVQHEADLPFRRARKRRRQALDAGFGRGCDLALRGRGHPWPGGEDADLRAETRGEPQHRQSEHERAHHPGIAGAHRDTNARIPARNVGWRSGGESRGLAPQSTTVSYAFCRVQKCVNDEFEDWKTEELEATDPMYTGDVAAGEAVGGVLADDLLASDSLVGDTVVGDTVVGDTVVDETIAKMMAEPEPDHTPDPMQPVLDGIRDLRDSLASYQGLEHLLLELLKTSERNQSVLSDEIAAIRTELEAVRAHAVAAADRVQRPPANTFDRRRIRDSDGLAALQFWRNVRPAAHPGQTAAIQVGVGAVALVLIAWAISHYVSTGSVPHAVFGLLVINVAGVAMVLLRRRA